MDKAKSQLDVYTENSSQNPHFIAFEMVESNKSKNPADDLLNSGE